ncbi:MAG: bis(5'-nucleosyl)-tetraphosphatase [Candidatus Thorarchaeota archaeon]
MDLKEEKSIAAIVYYQKEYLLLKYGLGHWEFVKGHIERDETEKDTIMRELEEETSITDASIIDGFSEKYDYYFTWGGNKIHKFVTCYLIKSNTQDVSLSYEHVGYKWLPFKSARKQLTYDNAKRILTKAYNFRTLTSN